MSNFPTEADVAFFEAKRAPTWVLVMRQAKTKQPSWSGRKRPIDLIDSCVNAHAGIRMTSSQCAAHNLMAIVKGWQRRKEDLVAALELTARHPQCAISPAKRAALALKWAKRLRAA
jgi:hypothetical protein